MKYLIAMSMLLLCSFCSVQAQQNENQPLIKNNENMKTYVIERIIPGAGNLSATELKGISQKSCDVLKEMGEDIEWVKSYVTGDKVYCVYNAQSIALVKEHAKTCGFPANSINEVATTIGPETAER